MRIENSKSIACKFQKYYVEIYWKIYLNEKKINESGKKCKKLCIEQ